MSSGTYLRQSDVFYCCLVLAADCRDLNNGAMVSPASPASSCCCPYGGLIKQDVTFNVTLAACAGAVRPGGDHCRGGSRWGLSCQTQLLADKTVSLRSTSVITVHAHTPLHLIKLAMSTTSTAHAGTGTQMFQDYLASMAPDGASVMSKRDPYYQRSYEAPEQGDGAYYGPPSSKLLELSVASFSNCAARGCWQCSAPSPVAE
jgi:hypothetical protein